LQARYENPNTGQFISEDPVFLGDPSQQTLTDAQSLNSYSYANDNPITKSDPNGRAIEDFFGEVAITLTNEADAYISEAFTTESSVTVSNTATQTQVPNLTNLEAPESFQETVGWQSQEPSETTLINWRTGTGLLLSGSVSAGLLWFMANQNEIYPSYVDTIDPFRGMADPKKSPRGSIVPKGVPQTGTVKYPATIGRSQQQNVSPAVPRSSGSDPLSGVRLRDNGRGDL